jgi:hypothetical protein
MTTGPVTGTSATVYTESEKGRKILQMELSGLSLRATQKEWLLCIRQQNSTITLGREENPTGEMLHHIWTAQLPRLLSLWKHMITKLEELLAYILYVFFFLFQ